MEDDEEYDDEIYYKFYLYLKFFKIIILLLTIFIIFKLRDVDKKDKDYINITITNKSNNKSFNSRNENSGDDLNITINGIQNITNNSTKDFYSNTYEIQNIAQNIIGIDDNVNIYEEENISNIFNGNLIKISNYYYSKNPYLLDFFKILTYFNITYINYTISPKFNRTKLEYILGIYDKDKKLNSPSDLTLYHNFRFICYITIPEINKTIYSIPNNYENKYIKCIEYFDYGENITFGIRIYHKQINLTLNFSSENILDYNDTNNINDSLFDPEIIEQEYNKSFHEIHKYNTGKTYYLKRAYFKSPNFDLRRDNFSESGNWTFDNFYNDYFCYCIGNNCFKKVTQECKYLFYLTIVDKYKNLYPKTEYIFSDFIFNHLSSDDAYPIFQEMIKQNYSAHYLTENKKIIYRYCRDFENCNSIIFVNVRTYLDYADAIEKYLTLILKTKAFITCRSTDYHKVGQLLYKSGYITYITVGHGVCLFKDYLFSNQRIYGPDMNDKILIPPSKPLISIALKFGWKLENIIKINLPKWDKYDGNNKEIIENYVNNINNNSILVMFTYRMTKIAWNLEMSEFYFENITKLIFNERLQTELHKNNLTLYFSMHRMVNPGYQKEYKKKLQQHENIKILPQSALSECLSKTNLVITDFSSILFDLMYRGKPFIIYLPDGNDPLINNLYTPDYINLIHRMNKREFNITNICDTVEETVDKIIYYIKNKFTVDGELKKFFDYIGIKHEGSNIQKFIDYLVTLK